MPENSARNLTTFLCVRFCVYIFGSFSVRFAISGSCPLKRVRERAPVWTGSEKANARVRVAKKKNMRNINE